MSYGNIQYKQQSLNTMTQGELLNVLYDEAIKRLFRAEFSLKNEDFEDFEDSINRVDAIIKHLKRTLNKDFDVSRQLSKLYEFFSYQLVRIKIGRNLELIEELKPLIEELRDTFKEADGKRISIRR